MLAIRYNDDILWQISKKQGKSVWCELKRGKWPKELFPFPPEYEGMDEQTKEQLRKRIMLFIENGVGEKAVLRQWYKEQQDCKDQLFDDWWESQIRTDLRQCMNLLNECSENVKEVLGQKTKEKCNERHYNRNFILRSVSSFLIGAILSALFNSFGFGPLLFALFACGLCFFLGHSF